MCDGRSWEETGIVAAVGEFAAEEEGTVDLAAGKSAGVVVGNTAPENSLSDLEGAKKVEEHSAAELWL